MQYTALYKSPIGEMTLASDGELIIGIWFNGQKYFASTLSEDSVEKQVPVFEECKNWLDIYFNGEMPNFTPPLKMIGTPFRKKVWQILLTISFGKTMTYGEIAQLLFEKDGAKHILAQAVGGAVGHNPISLIVLPCHRVVAANSNLTGYAAGIDKKEWLLEHEGIKIN